MGYEFDGVVYEKLREMQEARRARYIEFVSGGMNFTQAAKAVGVSKRTGKVGIATLNWTISGGTNLPF